MEGPELQGEKKVASDEKKKKKREPCAIAGRDRREKPGADFGGEKGKRGRFNPCQRRPRKKKKGLQGRKGRFGKDLGRKSPADSMAKKKRSLLPSSREKKRAGDCT